MRLELSNENVIEVGRVGFEFQQLPFLAMRSFWQFVFQNLLTYAYGINWSRLFYTFSYFRARVEFYRPTYFINSVLFFIEILEECKSICVDLKGQTNKEI